MPENECIELLNENETNNQEYDGLLEQERITNMVLLRNRTEISEFCASVCNKCESDKTGKYIMQYLDVLYDFKSQRYIAHGIFTHYGYPFHVHSSNQTMDAEGEIFTDFMNDFYSRKTAHLMSDTPAGNYPGDTPAGTIMTTQNEPVFFNNNRFFNFDIPRYATEVLENGAHINLTNNLVPVASVQTRNVGEPDNGTLVNRPFFLRENIAHYYDETGIMREREEELPRPEWDRERAAARLEGRYSLIR